MSEIVKLGEKLSGDVPRDAIHIAIAPVTAGQILKPGEHVGFLSDGRVGKTRVTIGVIDPFLTSLVNVGDQVYILLNPYTITSLRHQWTHPAFDNNYKSVVESKSIPSGALKTSANYIRREAGKLGLSYEQLIEITTDWVLTGEVFCGGEDFMDAWVDEEFFHHFSIVTGMEVPEDRRHSFFRCAC